MDHETFDRIAAMLGAAGSRRAGIAAAFVALGARQAAAARPRPQGPCGNGRKRNLCNGADDCCTGICDRDVDNLDGKGRCRCRKRGEACGEDRNCCSRGGQGMVCLGGVCAAPCIGLGLSCEGANAVCCSGVCGGTQLLAGARLLSDVCCLQTGQTGCTDDVQCCGAGTGRYICRTGVCVDTCADAEGRPAYC